ncbi:hypothetical protein/tRNA(fMet)-specific endonuclease VapC [Granulicella rosea]|uniref:PIN domain-containing protein n=1 Tax=Granulicella rosea TaxID=474952 RepID=A0A239DDL2_9BACT|nr:type II toxin-antitoxin system VapC family toxin [Granulicella rosea]SNS30001.1 hypothetical protein/tRNA(fMet)-specific endonuclease VapC [Granulicella rosea]
MNGFLLDTNIPSELIRIQPEPRVMRWVYGQEEALLFLSAMSIGELRRGFVTLAPGRRRTQLENWLEGTLLQRFQGRILPVDHIVANRWGVLDGQAQLAGKPMSTADGLIAATALEHGLTLVTRNMKDFVGRGLTLLNPWDELP